MVEEGTTLRVSLQTDAGFATTVEDTRSSQDSVRADADAAEDRGGGEGGPKGGPWAAEMAREMREAEPPPVYPAALRAQRRRR